MASPNISSKRHWLLVLPDSAQLAWRNGETTTSSYQTCLETITRYQHLSGTAPLTARFLSLRPGDVLWLALPTVGVIGRGVVEAVHGRPEADVVFTVDPDASRVLAADPLPARHMGKAGVGLAEAAPTPLHEEPAAIEAFEWWWRELGTLDARQLKVLDDVTPTREVKGWSRRVVDDPVLAATSRTLRGAGLSVGTPGRGSKLDLIGLDGARLIGATVIAGPRKQITDRALAALGPGMHHLWAMEQTLDDSSVRRSYWLAFEADPELDLLEFLEQAGAGVVWLDDGILRPGPRTAEQLSQLARAPEPLGTLD